ncbi:cupredoxin domain-containing protein [Cryptosporangium sp. NPDC048952]|uniref:cupredoxin domain-containing protein n=1 Tax=Cryptosporangium sp. NPDC048952 TaxID=3363961 RepID=UPI003713F321
MLTPLAAVGVPVISAALSVLVVGACSNGGPGGDANEVPTTMATATAGADGVQTVTVTGDDQLRYEPSVIKAKPGKLRITLRTIGGTPHDLEVRPAKINTGLVSKDQERSVEVTLSRGRYDFVCTFHLTSNMVGVIDVS